MYGEKTEAMRLVKEICIERKRGRGKLKKKWRMIQSDTRKMEVYEEGAGDLNGSVVLGWPTPNSWKRRKMKRRRNPK